jgi:Phage derived protein Gp49-like (DUF891)
MALEPFHQGRWGSIVLATPKGGSCPASEFIAELSTPDKAKIYSLMKRAAEFGPMNIHNGEKFKKIADGWFEFKCFQIRMPCYYEGNSLVVTHGFKKKQDSFSPTELERAKRIRAEHEAHVGSSKSRRNKEQ